MERNLEQIFGPAFLIFGVSHFLYPQRWAELFAEMKKTRFAGFVIAMYTLPSGLVLIVGHNRWELDWPVFLTVMGWAMTFKSALYVLFPQAAELVIRRGVEQ